jgi:hypothetical protein
MSAQLVSKSSQFHGTEHTGQSSLFGYDTVGTELFLEENIRQYFPPKRRVNFRTRLTKHDIIGLRVTVTAERTLIFS